MRGFAAHSSEASALRLCSAKPAGQAVEAAFMAEPGDARRRRFVGEANSGEGPQAR